MSTYQYYVDKISVELDIFNQDISKGSNIILAKENADVTSNTDWYQNGYTITKPFQSKDQFLKLIESCTRVIKKALANFEIYYPENFKLEDYHLYVTSDEIHKKIINHTRNLAYEDFEFNIEELMNYFRSFLAIDLHSFNKTLLKKFIILRISRPNKPDVNPPHKDGYLDLWMHAVNIWIPVAGETKKSSLPIVPKSHLFFENEILRTQSGAIFNGTQYHVPAIINWKGENKLIRSDVELGEALIFSPYLIHGCAINHHATKTRFALELRPTYE
jgi:ectoine hydroxylase-related dioxygenase (phytanoyl-CoA dioxygenase family)